AGHAVFRRPVAALLFAGPDDRHLVRHLFVGIRGRRPGHVDGRQARRPRQARQERRRARGALSLRAASLATTITMTLDAQTIQAFTPTGKLRASINLGNPILAGRDPSGQDRKSTRLNSSHVKISYAVFCLKKKTKHSSPPP